MTWHHNLRYEFALRVVCDFTEGLNGDNPEYERGQLELLADLFPIFEVATGDRAQQIAADIREMAERDRVKAERDRRPTTRTVELPEPTPDQQYVLNALRFPGNADYRLERDSGGGFGDYNHAIHELSRLGYLKVTYQDNTPVALQITRTGMEFVPPFERKESA